MVLNLCALRLWTSRPHFRPSAMPLPWVPLGGRARRRRLLSPVLLLWAQRKPMKSTQVHTHAVCRNKMTLYAMLDDTSTPRSLLQLLKSDLNQISLQSQRSLSCSLYNTKSCFCCVSRKQAGQQTARGRRPSANPRHLGTFTIFHPTWSSMTSSKLHMPITR